MQQYGLIGKKLGHSFSKKYFTKKFEDLKLEAKYDLYELAQIEELTDLFETHPNLRGLNVTIPYKSEVIPFMDELSPEAAAVQAVNTILFDNGKRIGHNSDVYGFSKSLETLILNQPIEQALILGTGGAAKAVAYVLGRKKISFKYVSRNPHNDQQLRYESLTADQLQPFPLIINTTPLGMYPHVDAAPAIDYQALNAQHFLFDLIYNPEQTLFMKKGIEQGATVQNGMEMLVLQAERSWEIWGGGK
ncbi:UNVERIFIED_CONTAM: hypothetical protein GTU68_041189 [Idotea baltica]|nr:hypothetical protein [Idotea baltica]